MRIGIIGTGYVGLVTGLCFAELGHKVTFVDIDNKKISGLRKGKIDFYEPNLNKLINKSLKKENISFTSKYDVLSNSRIVFICVGTPSRKNGTVETRYFDQAFKRTLKLSPKDNLTIVIKSTVPIGTFQKYEKLLLASNKSKLSLVSNPEFLREGSSIYDFFNPDRVIIGARNQKDKKLLKGLYTKNFSSKTKIYLVSPESAEIIKYASNVFLGMKVSYINELSRVSEIAGANIDEVSSGIGADKRIGERFLRAGIGYGGSCFPKDIDGFIAYKKEKKLASGFAEVTKKINEQQYKYFLSKLFSRFGSSLKTKSICFWGTSFKPNTSDMRNSVSIKIIKKILPKVKQVFIHDPICTKDEILCEFRSNRKKINLIKDKYECLINSDILIICTEWGEYSEIDYKKLTSKIIFDGRNILDPKKLADHSVEYHAIGM